MTKNQEIHILHKEYVFLIQEFECTVFDSSTNGLKHMFLERVHLGQKKHLFVCEKKHLFVCLLAFTAWMVSILVKKTYL